MLKNYKKSYLIINIVLSLLILFLLLNLFVFKQDNYLFLICTIFIPTILLILVYGYERKNRRFKYELLFYVFAYTILFLVVTYMIGISVGFVKNVYRLNLSNIIHNIIPYTLLIIVSEILRYEISRKGDGSLLSYILVTIALLLVDASLFLNTYNLSVGTDQIKYICAILMPSLFKNIILLYFTKNGGMAPSLVYRLLLDLKLVVLPFFPNFGLYADCLINTILPVLMFFLIYIHLKQFKNKEDLIYKEKVPYYKYIFYFIVITLILIINILVSCAFKYCMIAIASNSMVPTFARGDVVIYEKYNENNPPKEGDIIVFAKEDRIIVHRVIKTINVNENEMIYYTKGDNNAAEDGYPIKKDSIKGVVKLTVKYIGMPSVKIGELIK